MNKPGYKKYESWDHFKAKLQKTCTVTEEDTNTLQKIQNIKYKGDIVAYLDKIHFYNEHVSLTRTDLRNIIMDSLPEPILCLLLSCKSMSTDASIWKMVLKAEVIYEQA